ncbi:hypothetical protein DFJ63DRAFT_312550 [Scheffersomyces coipomensis]|uniref:uncharacterized protein n=1 Tax=Scheffersomyces coipomensis TaxID=1788519 RepID=UPI00315DABEC
MTQSRKSTINSSIIIDTTSIDEIEERGCGLSSSSSYLNTPPTTPDLKRSILDIINSEISYIQSPLMPNPSKIKVQPFTWDQIEFIVGSNQLQVLARSKSETKRYLQFKQDLKESNSNILDYLLHHELQWKDEDINNKETNKIFNMHTNDVKILYNKFPYYFEPNVYHLCIWSKNRMEVDINSEEGDITDDMKNLIETYINLTFVKGLNIPKENIVWFKNWGNLQSVKDISHIHVLIKDDDGRVKPLIDQYLIGNTGVLFQ